LFTGVTTAARPGLVEVTGGTATESTGHPRTRGRRAWSVAGRRLGDRCITVRPCRCLAAASGRAGQHVESSTGPAERCSTCAGRSSGRVTDHALKGGIEAWPVMITAQVACPDPLVDGDPREWRLPSGRQCAGGLEDQPPILSALGHTPSLSPNIKAGDGEVGQLLRILAVGSSALSAACECVWLGHVSVSVRSESAVGACRLVRRSVREFGRHT
jgi:hypothetical protein